MKRTKQLLPLLVIIISASAAPADVVFSDTFGSSTMNSASPALPTATSSDYAVLSTKNATSSALAGNKLTLTMPATTSGFVEAQTRFAATPFTLAATGHYIQLVATFTTTAGILAGPGTGSYLSMGLFNSGGANPVSGGVLNNSGLNTTAGSTYATGNAGGWAGYMGRVRETTGSSRINARPVQNGAGTTSANQDLIFGGETGGYANPGAVQIGSSATFNSTLTPNSQYTLSFKLTYDAGTGFVTAEQKLFEGAGLGGANLYTLTGTSGASSTPTLQFDGLAIGYRFAESVGAASTLDISQIQVIAQVPEPGAAALFLLGAGLFLARRRS